ncbi:MAG: hypothetical protein UR26_C0001G0227 [candidate division TM6 bacterium GW2011_GWF2_32_72]|nr:MAG: hypothetical protein UR26_C0001G0227 [candidate division TM6 bacterium GW2011_GWF2_32_72]
MNRIKLSIGMCAIALLSWSKITQGTLLVAPNATTFITAQNTTSLKNSLDQIKTELTASNLDATRKYLLYSTQSILEIAHQDYSAFYQAITNKTACISLDSSKKDVTTGAQNNPINYNNWENDKRHLTIKIQNVLQQIQKAKETAAADLKPKYDADYTRLNSCYNIYNGFYTEFEKGSIVNFVAQIKGNIGLKYYENLNKQQNAFGALATALFFYQGSTYPNWLLNISSAQYIQFLKKINMPEALIYQIRDTLFVNNNGKIDMNIATTDLPGITEPFQYPCFINFKTINKENIQTWIATLIKIKILAETNKADQTLIIDPTDTTINNLEYLLQALYFEGSNTPPLLAIILNALPFSSTIQTKISQTKSDIRQKPTFTLPIKPAVQITTTPKVSTPSVPTLPAPKIPQPKAPSRPKKPSKPKGF